MNYLPVASFSGVRNGHVLVIENDIGLRDALGELLVLENYHVWKADGLCSGEALLREYVDSVTVVVLDGYLAATQLSEWVARFRRINPQLHVVVTTPLQSMTVCRQNQSTNVACLLRPFSTADFLSAVGRSNI